MISLKIGPDHINADAIETVAPIVDEANPEASLGIEVTFRSGRTARYIGAGLHAAYEAWAIGGAVGNRAYDLDSSQPCHALNRGPTLRKVDPRGHARRGGFDWW